MVEMQMCRYLLRIYTKQYSAAADSASIPDFCTHSTARVHLLQSLQLSLDFWIYPTVSIQAVQKTASNKSSQYYITPTPLLQYNLVP